ncbi:MAG TPA: STAS domain-containing protein [Candidatus Angelobacter sp.]|jgi:anti-anti-sigma regulatory factor|nr:STAS domain-containing protein [Candidatus Angelobacter sp.]
MTIASGGWLVDGDHIAESLQRAQAKSASGEGNLVLDFTGVRRIDPSGVSALEEIVNAGEPAKVVLVGVNVTVYKVLKLAKLGGRLSFIN